DVGQHGGDAGGKGIGGHEGGEHRFAADDDRRPARVDDGAVVAGPRLPVARPEDLGHEGDGSLGPEAGMGPHGGGDLVEGRPRVGHHRCTIVNGASTIGQVTPPSPKDTPVAPALPAGGAVVNVGLSLFAEAVAAQGRPVADVDWRIPAGGDPEAVAALRRLYGPRAPSIDEANAEVVRRLDSGVPLLVGLAPAAEVVPGLGERTILHCGPPIEWRDVCDPLRRSIRAAVMAEGWAADPDEAGALVEKGEVALEPANHHDTVVPMASAIGPSAWVWIVENRDGGTRAFSAINQGPGEVPWFGRETPAAVERLRFLRDVAG